MAEYDYNTNWNSIIESLVASINGTSVIALKLVWLCEILVLVTCRDNTRALRKRESDKVLITHKRCIAWLSTESSVNSEFYATLFRYRDTFVHRGYPAHTILSKLVAEDVETVFTQYGCHVGAAEIQEFINTPTLRAMQL